MIRAYCRDHVAEMGFSTRDYRPPTNSGECDTTLSMKGWGHRKELICYPDMLGGLSEFYRTYGDHIRENRFVSKLAGVSHTAIDLEASS